MIEHRSDRYETCAIASVGGATAHLHYPVERPDYAKAFPRFAARAPKPPEPEILELDDVVLGDGRDWACLYDRDGRRIDAAALVRFDENLAPQLWRAASMLELPQKLRTISEPIVYGSIFFNHWGHFLLESIARLWAKREHSELASLPVAYAWPQAQHIAPIAAFFSGAEARLLSADIRRVRLAKCFVPTASFAHEGYADARHLGVAHQVARHFWRGGERDEQPVYLSRTQVAAPVAGRLRVSNEAELEARLEERGVQVLHMQALTLAEQIAVMNARRTFIGLWGSAMHNTLFTLDNSKLSTFTLLDDDHMAANFLLVDSLVGADAHYLNTVRDLGDGVLWIDIEATLAYLDDFGVLRAQPSLPVGESGDGAAR